MKKLSPKFDLHKLHLPLLVIASFVAALPLVESSFSDLYAENSKKVIGPKKGATPDKIDRNMTAMGPKAGQVLDKGQFGRGFDASKTPSWSKWKSSPAGEVEVPEYFGPPSILGIAKPMALGGLEKYDTSANEEPIVVAIKADDILGRARDVVSTIDFGNPKMNSLSRQMMNTADDTVQQVDIVYKDVHDMYMNADMMKLQLSRNYDIFNASEMGEKQAGEFNAQSDAMAERASGMVPAVDAMHSRTANDRDLLSGMMEVLDDMAASGKDDVAYYEKVYTHLKDVSLRYEGLAKNLAADGAVSPSSLEQGRKYLLSLQNYVKGQKPYAAGNSDYLKQVRSYVQRSKDYLDKVVTDLDTAKKDLTANVEYFRGSKVTPAGARDMIEAAPLDAGDVCSAPIDQYKDVGGMKIKKNAQELEKDKPLQTLQDCAKSCRTVCRFKDKRGGQNCYECPSGSPDSCFDVGAWPANHPWCQPGGPCYDDPMMYCSPFGTISPTNKEKLECTNCKVRPDMCWQKVGGGMTYTNCKMGCWNGKCVFKGKYQEFEWDGKLEWVHCYECKTPPGPPSCEDLGWGTTWYGDCKKGCPDPGDCVQKNTKVPGKPAPPPGQPPGGGGQQGGDQPQGGGQGDGTQADGGAPAGGGSKPPEQPPVPGDNPQQPEGGGGSIAGGKKEEGRPLGGQPQQPSGGEQKPGDDPGGTEPRQPNKPNTGDKPEPPPPPPPPPDTPMITMYREQLAKTEERIKHFEGIINDPNEPESVKESAREYLESTTRQRDADKKKLEDEQKKEADRIREEEERKKKAEEYERTRVRTPDYAEEARKRGEAWLLNQLKNATKALEDKLREAQQTIQGRKERLERIREEIARLERENQHYKEGSESGNVDSTVARDQTKANNDRIKQLKQNYAQLEKQLREATQKFNEELEKLKSDYRRALWAYDKKSQARANAERTDEYFERYSELQNARATRAERNRTFDELAKSMEAEIAAKKARGEDTDELERQLENIKRSQAEWNERMARQEKGIEDQLYALERRNFSEGAGPSSPEDLGKALAKFHTDFSNQLAETQRTIAELEKLSTRTKEQNDLLNTLKAKVGDLQNSIDAVTEKQAQFKSGALTEEHRQRVHETTLKVASGAMNTDADKSFARLFAESLAEEAVHNMNPLVMAKKSLAFGVGVVQGVGTAVAGLVELGVGAVDLTLETYLTNLGFDIETDALDSLNAMIDTVSSNANFDGVIKAVVAAGGAIDAKLNELGKGDIDWNTANFGGKVAGELVVADAVIAGAVGKAGQALGLVDDGLDAARAGSKLDDMAKAGTTTERAAAGAGSHLNDGGIPPGPTGFADDAGKAGTGTRGPPPESGKTVPHTEGPKTLPHEPPTTPRTVPHDELPKTLPHEGPKPGDIPPTPKPGEVPAGGSPETPKTNVGPETPKYPDAPAPKPGDAVPPPTRGGVTPDSTTTFTGPDGKPVTIQTGKELGHGSTSVVYENAAQPGRAIRITEPGKAGITHAGQLDEAGRKAVESIATKDGPIRLPDSKPPVTVNDPSSPLHGKIVQDVEHIKNGDANQFLGGGPMSEGQARALDDAMKALNDKGYAWMDNHGGNYAFEQVGTTGDQWKVVVLDPGGIVKMHSADDAIALQKRLSQGDEGLRNMVKEAQAKRAKWAAENPGKQRGKDMLDNIISAEAGDIMNEFASKIDHKAMGLNDPYDVAFYPFGTLDYPNLQSRTLGR